MSAQRVADGEGLSAHVLLPSRDVDVALALAPGKTLALIGPNGAGKSSVLSAIAGLIDAEESVVRVGQTSWVTGGRQLPVRERHVGYVTQAPLLFPHLTCRQNVAFGLRANKVPRSDAEAQADDWLNRVGCGSLGGRRPHEVSGGQAARVALARALAPSPSLLLLDEPFAALDVDAVVEMRTLTGELARDTMTVIITHDVADVAALSDDVVILGNGRVVESGTTRDVLTNPASMFGQSFADRTVLEGRIDNGELRAGPIHALTDRADGEVRVSWSPTDWRMVGGGPSWASVHGPVERLVPRGAYTRISVEGVDADVALHRGLEVGDVVTLALDETSACITATRAAGSP